MTELGYSVTFANFISDQYTRGQYVKEMFLKNADNGQPVYFSCKVCCDRILQRSDGPQQKYLPLDNVSNAIKYVSQTAHPTTNDITLHYLQKIEEVQLSNEPDTPFNALLSRIYLFQIPIKLVAAVVKELLVEDRQRFLDKPSSEHYRLTITLVFTLA